MFAMGIMVHISPRSISFTRRCETVYISPTVTIHTGDTQVILGEKLLDGYPSELGFNFFRQLCKIQCGFEHTDTMQTHFECTHIQKSFMALRFPTLSCTSASSACAHDGVQIRSFNLVTLVSYLKILGVVVFSI